MKKSKLLLLLLLCTLLPTVHGRQKHTEDKITMTEFPEFVTDNYNDTHELMIKQEADLSGFPGSGTKADPYRIEGYNFSASDQRVDFLIGIFYTQVYILIQNNHFKPGNRSNSIYVSYDVSNLIIRNNTFEMFDEYNGYEDQLSFIGIKNIVITNNTIYATRSGIFLGSGSNGQVSRNIIYTQAEGITSYHFQDLIISNNIVKLYNREDNDNGPSGIQLYESNDAIITHNVIYDIPIGLYLLHSYNSNITFNEIYNTTFALNLETSRDFT